jgi:hypothetical protein
MTTLENFGENFRVNNDNVIFGDCHEKTTKINERKPRKKTVYRVCAVSLTVLLIRLFFRFMALTSSSTKKKSLIVAGISVVVELQDENLLFSATSPNFPRVEFTGVLTKPPKPLTLFEKSTIELKQPATKDEILLTVGDFFDVRLQGMQSSKIQAVVQIPAKKQVLFSIKLGKKTSDEDTVGAYYFSSTDETHGIELEGVSGTIFNVIECVSNGHPVWFNAFGIPPEDGTTSYEVHSLVSTFLTGPQYIRLDITTGMGLTFFISLNEHGKYILGVYFKKKIVRTTKTTERFYSDFFFYCFF